MTIQTLNDRENYLVLYTLMVLPLISICDEVTFDDLWEDVILGKNSLDAATFSTVLKMVQDRFQCLGITCSMVGRSLGQDSSWPECVDNAPSNRLELAGYTPATDESLSVSFLRFAHNYSTCSCLSPHHKSLAFLVVKN